MYPFIENNKRLDELVHKKCINYSKTFGAKTLDYSINFVHSESIKGPAADSNYGFNCLCTLRGNSEYRNHIVKSAKKYCALYAHLVQCLLMKEFTLIVVIRTSEIIVYEN